MIASTYIYTHAHTYTCMHAQISTHTCTHIYVHMHSDPLTSELDLFDALNCLPAICVHISCHHCGFIRQNTFASHLNNAQTKRYLATVGEQLELHVLNLRLIWPFKSNAYRSVFRLSTSSQNIKFPCACRRTINSGQAKFHCTSCRTMQGGKATKEVGQSFKTGPNLSTKDCFSKLKTKVSRSESRKPMHCEIRKQVVIF